MALHLLQCIELDTFVYVIFKNEDSVVLGYGTMLADK
jgi:hypothetical protein